MHCYGLKVIWKTDGHLLLITVHFLQCGVPQCSILGPLLFLIYINDLANVCTSYFSILFADDTNLFNHGKCMFSLQVALNQKLSNISKWPKFNKLSFNIKKTMYMIFTKKTRPIDVKIKIDKEIISETKSSKFLGLHIVNMLNWKIYIDYVSGKTTRGIGIPVKARKVLSNECMANLYYEFIYPYLIYWNDIWGNTYKTTLWKLRILLKKLYVSQLGPHPELIMKLSIDKIVCWIKTR